MVIHFDINVYVALMVFFEILIGLGMAFGKDQKVRWKNRKHSDFFLTILAAILFTYRCIYISITSQIDAFDPIAIGLLAIFPYVWFGKPEEQVKGEDKEGRKDTLYPGI